MKRLFQTFLVVAAVSGAAACDDSPTSPSLETATFKAALAPANEVPPVSNTESSGSGTATIVLKVSRDGAGAITSATADFQVDLTGYAVGTALTMAHIHRGAVGTNGDIVVDTGLTAGEIVFTSGSRSFSKVGISVTPGLAQEILSGPANFYFNVHSIVNPSGMARGQLVRQ